MGKSSSPGPHSPDAAPPPRVRNSELEANIERDPDSVDAYRVYGDRLAAQGDPRGELIAVQTACAAAPESVELGETETEFLRAHGDELLGPLQSLSDRRKFGGRPCLEWACGFIRSATIEDDAEQSNAVRELGDLLSHPSGRFVQELSIDTHEPAAAVAALGARTLPTLRSLEIEDSYRAQVPIVVPAGPDHVAYQRIGPNPRAQEIVRLGPEIFANMPRLERLVLRNVCCDLSVVTSIL
jgi:uncharacterized protein (TIGR02996 family)